MRITLCFIRLFHFLLKLHTYVALSPPSRPAIMDQFDMTNYKQAFQEKTIAEVSVPSLSLLNHNLNSSWQGLLNIHNWRSSPVVRWKSCICNLSPDCDIHTSKGWLLTWVWNINSFMDRQNFAAKQHKCISTRTTRYSWHLLRSSLIRMALTSLSGRHKHQAVR